MPPKGSNPPGRKKTVASSRRRGTRNITNGAKTNKKLGEKLPIHAKPELFIALVGPVGTDLTTVESELKTCLKAYGYRTESVRVIELLKTFPKWSHLKEITELDERYDKFMTAGNKFCELIGRKDALAALAINKVQATRKQQKKIHTEPLNNVAFIFHSFKRPEEIALLRRVYGPALLVVSVYEPKSARSERLAERICKSHNLNQADPFKVRAEELINRDEAEQGDPYGQNIRKTFQLADVFVQLGSTGVSKIHNPIDRMLRLLFGYPYSTPTKDEYGMFHAFAASLRSAALGRQVGSAIARDDGEIIALGVNEVPKAFGGLYWEDDKRTETDQRDYVWKKDPSDENRRNLAENFLEVLSKNRWLNKDKTNKTINELMVEFEPLLKQTLVMDVTEFNRTVHAEMSAIVDSARRGVSVNDATIYVTTFPCHECTRHLIAAGIKRVVYISPYAKSLAFDLHKDAILIDNPDGAKGKKVSFEPFVGIAHRVYPTLFEMKGENHRKDIHGNTFEWDPLEAFPLFADSKWEYPTSETVEVKILNDRLRAKKLTPTEAI